MSQSFHDVSVCSNVLLSILFLLCFVSVLFLSSSSYHSLNSTLLSSAMRWFIMLCCCCFSNVVSQPICHIISISPFWFALRRRRESMNLFLLVSPNSRCFYIHGCVSHRDIKSIDVFSYPSHVSSSVAFLQLCVGYHCPKSKFIETSIPYVQYYNHTNQMSAYLCVYLLVKPMKTKMCAGQNQQLCK